jgi:hypothetical protein
MAMPIDNGNMAIFLVLTTIGLLSPLFDVVSDWTVSIQTAISEEKFTLYGDIKILARYLGIFMIVVNYLSGLRAALWEMEDLAWKWKPLALLVAPVANLACVWYRLLAIKMCFTLKKVKPVESFKSSKKIGALKLKGSASALIEAKWESIPSMILTCFKVGLAHQISLLEFFSILSSAGSISFGLLTHYNNLRKKAGKPELGFIRNVGLTLLCVVPIFSTITTSTVFAIEAERDGFFAPVSDNPDETTPGLLFLLMALPIILLFLSLAATPFFTFVVIPYNRMTLKYCAQRMSKVSLCSRIFIISLLFGVNIFSSMYFIKRDHFPNDADAIFKDCSYRKCQWSSTFDFKVSHGRRMLQIFYIMLATLCCVAFLASLLVIMKWKAQAELVYKSLFSDETTTEAEKLLL